jgi:hypothetical protein
VQQAEAGVNQGRPGAIACPPAPLPEYSLRLGLLVRAISGAKSRLLNRLGEETKGPGD